MSEEKSQFENLPPHIIDKIFQYLPFTEIARVSVVSPFFLKVGDSVIRKSFFSLHSEIHKELNLLKQELDAIPRMREHIHQRIPFLRSYYILERHLSELTIMKAVWRGIIYDKARCSICIAKLLQEFTTSLTAAKRRNLPQWSISNEIELKINRISKIYFEYKVMDLQLDYLFGCRIIDVMDSCINKMYNIKVIYNVEGNTCIIDATYHLIKPHVLHAPPKLTDPTNYVPSMEDRRKIYTYLINLVRINNRVTLREEQYQRERSLDSSSEWELVEEDLEERQLWGTNDVRTYYLVLPNPQRVERIVDGKHIFEETYHSPELQNLLPLSSSEKKFICTIHLECRLNEAPLSIIDCWKRIRSELITSGSDDNDLMLRSPSSHSFSGQSDNNNEYPRVLCTEDYNCDCNFEITPIHSSEVQRLILKDP